MPYPVALINRLAAMHDVVGEPILMPDCGMVNEAWRIGSCILRIVKEGNHAECDSEVLREGLAVPLALSAGMRTPRLLGSGLADDNAPRPYSIYEFIEAEVLGYSDYPVESFLELYYQLGAELALLHQIEIDDTARHIFEREDKCEPETEAHRCVLENRLSKSEEKEIIEWTYFLKSCIGVAPQQIVHNDVHSWNVMYDPADNSLASLIDWGDTIIGDPAADFSMMPLECVPEMLRGYVDSGGVVEDGFMARAMYIGLHLRLWELRKLDVERFDRRWWACPPGGWTEMKTLIERHFPELASF